MLALASNDNIIYLYNAEDGYPLVAKCEKHSASVRHLDFALSGAYLQSNCTAFELLYVLAMLVWELAIRALRTDALGLARPFLTIF